MSQNLTFYRNISNKADAGHELPMRPKFSIGNQSIAHIGNQLVIITD